MTAHINNFFPWNVDFLVGGAASTEEIVLRRRRALSRAMRRHNHNGDCVRLFVAWTELDRIAPELRESPEVNECLDRGERRLRSSMGTNEVHQCHAEMRRLYREALDDLSDHPRALISERTWLSVIDKFDRARALDASLYRVLRKWEIDHTPVPDRILMMDSEIYDRIFPVNFSDEYERNSYSWYERNSYSWYEIFPGHNFRGPIGSWILEKSRIVYPLPFDGKYRKGCIPRHLLILLWALEGAL